MNTIADPEEFAGRAAADRLAEEWHDVSWAPADPSCVWAKGAVDRFGELVRDQLPIFRISQKNADKKAKSLSPRPFQGLTETLQNADDLGATVVRFAYRSSPRPELLLIHDGRPVKLKDMGAMVLPWLSAKDDDDEASGRFGIGQKTLQALGGPIAMHCPPYHFEMRADHPVSTEAQAAIPGVYDPEARETLLSVPLLPKYDLESVKTAVAAMGVESLLFLGSVRRLEFHDLESGAAPDLYAIGLGESSTRPMMLGEEEVIVDTATIAVMSPSSESGRSFVRYWTRRPVPEGQERIDKNTGKITPLGLCIEQGGAGHGHLFDRVRMPVKVRFPVNLNAQFDPDAARTTILQLPWNVSRFEDLGAFLGSAALSAFEKDPAAAWSHVPLREEASDEDGWLSKRLKEDIADPCRERLAAGLLLPDQDGDQRLLSEFVYEAAELDGLLTPADQLLIDSSTAVVMPEHRDSGGRWREVLSELGRSRLLDFDDALEIFSHSESVDGRDPEWFVRMAALAGRSGSVSAFLLHRSVLLADESVVRAPGRGGSKILVRSAAPEALAVRLGLALPLHPAYLGDGADAVEACKQFEQTGVLVDARDTPEEALALLGRVPGFYGGGPVEAVGVSDSDLIAIRDAWVRTPRDHQKELAGRIGRNIKIRAVRYEGRGQAALWARPAEVYMPGLIDKEGDAFAKVASRTPGLLWADPDYATVLKQAGGRSEIGARKFLSALGVAASPRLTAPGDEGPVYSRDTRKVSSVNAPRPKTQAAAVLALNAAYLMDDRWSPDLEAVVQDIQRAPAKARRKRSLGLLSLLARHWEKRYADHQTANAVSAYNGALKIRGEVQATWLARLANVEWLPHGGGGYAAPGRLCLPTAANRLAYGSNRSAFLAAVASEVSGSGLLPALGVQPGPTTADLLARLNEYRGSPRTEATVQQVHGIYQLLADSLRASKSEAAMGRSLSPQQLRNAFRATAAGPGLILAQDGWHSPEAVFSGPQVFGTLRPFAPLIAGLEPLWARLDIQPPGPLECAAVLRDLSTEPLTPERRGIMLSTLRRLAETLDKATPQLRAGLKSLPLWTGEGWSKLRPAYVFEGDGLARADIAGATVWRPGLSSLRGLEPLLPVLGVKALRLEDFSAIRLTTLGLTGGRQHRARYARAVSLLAQALIRSDVALYESLRIGWDALQVAEFLLEPELEIGTAVPGEKPVRLAAGAHVMANPVHFVARSLDDAGDAQTGGQAIASLFSGDRQKVAWAWSSVWAKASAGQDEEQIVLPQLKAEATRGLDRLEQLKAQAEDRAKAKSGNGGAGGKSSETRARQPKIEVRQLRDLSALEPGAPVIVNAGASKQGVVFPKTKGPDLSRTFTKPDINKKESKPGKRSVLPPANDREAMALDAIRRALQLGAEQFRDVRERKGLGADAIDEMRQLYELKMTSGPDFPSEITLEASQIKAAMEDPENFFLALVAGLEDGAGQLKVRFIFRPLEVLQTKIPAAVTLTGVDAVEALEYPFVKAEFDKIGD
jgi:hypothetical protein